MRRPREAYGAATAIVLASLLPLIMGCGTADPVGGGQATSAEHSSVARTVVQTHADGSNTSNEPGMVSRTIVEMRADGSKASTFGMITIAEQQAELASWNAHRAERAAGKSGITADSLNTYTSDCALADFIVTDQTNFEGNELCFYNNAGYVQSADLGAFYRATCYVFGIYLPCDPWFSSGSNVIESWGIGDQGACFSGSGSSTDGSPDYLDMGYYSDFPGTCLPPPFYPAGCVEDYYVTNPGSYRSYMSSLEYVWVDYGSINEYDVCTY